MRPASSVPPVMQEMRRGAARRRPRNSTEVSILVEVDLGQGRVPEAVVVEEAAPELHPLVQGQADVLGLAVAQLGRLRRGESPASGAAES